jgi:hypothetical protein
LADVDVKPRKRIEVACNEAEPILERLEGRASLGDLGV